MPACGRAEWLEKLIEPLTSAPPRYAGRLLAPLLSADGHTPFEVAMGATVLPQLADVQPRNSCRPAAARPLQSAWKRGAIPNGWTTARSRLRLCAARKVSAVCLCAGSDRSLQAGGSLKSFFRQYYLYARGRQGEPVAGSATSSATDVSRRHSTIPPQRDQSWFCCVCHRASIPQAALSTVDAHAAQLKTDPHPRSSRRSVVPVIAYGRLAKMMGYPVGVWWRIQHKQKS